MTYVLLSKYNYQVVDIAPYHGHEEKLIDDIDEVKIVKRFKENILFHNLYLVDIVNQFLLVPMVRCNINNLIIIF